MFKVVVVELKEIIKKWPKFFWRNEEKPGLIYVQPISRLGYQKVGKRPTLTEYITKKGRRKGNCMSDGQQGTNYLKLFYFSNSNLVVLYCNKEHKQTFLT